MKPLFVFFIAIFVLSSCQKPETEFLIDSRDGHQYSTVKIGEQIWMAENLAYMPYVSESSDSSGIWVYNYDGRSVEWAKTLDNYLNFGCLYSWTVAMDISSEFRVKYSGQSDSLHQGICPEGWHLPSDSEWQKLEDFLEPNPDFIPSDPRQHTGKVGEMIKATSTWTDADKNNETGFGAFAAGFRYETGYFHNKGKYAYFWSSSEYYDKSALYRYLWDESPGTFRGYPLKINGMSIRCVKESSVSH